MARPDLSRRLAALERLARPANSLPARLASLTENEKARYDEWRADCGRWAAQFKQPGDLYEAMTENGFRPPQLDFDISRKLFDRPPHIMKGDSLDDARRKYENFAL